MAVVAAEAIRTRSKTHAQFSAMSEMRWRMLVNSLRTRRGRFELGSRIFTLAFFLLLWLGLGFGLGLAAWHFASENQLKMLSVLLWPLLLMWQMAPVMLASFQGNADLSILLRFPVSFLSFTLLYLLFGIFDLSTLFGGMALFGIWIGTVIARPQLAAWVALALVLFAVFNLLLTRMVFAWLDRWLAQRKTREILGMLILLFFLGLQLLNPVYYQRGSSKFGHSTTVLAERAAKYMQRPFPPALAASAIHLASQGNLLGALLPLGGICLFALAVGCLLVVRLRAEYRGENLGEAAAIASPATTGVANSMLTASPGRWLQGSGPIAAILEKELRYLSRSGAMLYGLVVPLVLLFLFGGSSEAAHTAAIRYALPVGVAYGFLGLTRIVGNSLGGEGSGIQLYFLSPTSFRTIMLAKNLLQIGLFGIELVLVCSIVWFRFGMPTPLMIATTFCWLLFALPVQLALGNVLSINMAYRMTLTRMSREQGAIGNGLLSLLIQLVLFALGAGVFFSLARFGHPGLASLVFLALAIGGFGAWMLVLTRVDLMANARRETLISTLVRTA